jgi:hypothetical protein
VKLLRPARELKRALSVARDEALPQYRGLLDQDCLELQKRYNAATPALQEAEWRRQQITERVEKHRRRLRDEVQREIFRHLHELASAIPRWSDDFQPQCRVEIVQFWKMKETIEELAAEIAEILKHRIEEETAKFQTNILDSLIRQRLQELGDDVAGPVSEFLSGVDQLKARLSGLAGDKMARSSEAPSALERVLSAAGGLFLGGPGMAYLSATFGYQEMLKGMLPAIAVVVGAILLGIANPLVLLAALLSAGGLQALAKRDAMTRDVKAKVASQIAESLKCQALQHAEQIADEVFRRTADLAAAIDRGLEIEIQSVRDQVEVVLADKQAGEAHVAEKRRRLDSTEAALVRLDAAVTDLVFALAKVD